MPSIEMLYFGIKGRAEPSRLALTAGGVEFTDKTIEFSEWPALKSSGKLPFGQLPMLTVDGVEYTQSEAMLRYCGKLAGLYPRDDDTLALAIDEALGAIGDVTAAIFSYKGKDKDEAKAAREDFVNTTGPKLLTGLEKVVSSKAKTDSWLCGSALSVADLQLFCVINNVKFGHVDHVSHDFFDAYPRLMASFNAVAAVPKISAWNESHPWKQAK